MPTDDLAFVPATRLAGMIRSREVSAIEVVRATLDRAEKAQAVFNCFITLCPERALEEAALPNATLELFNRGRLGALFLIYPVWQSFPRFAFDLSVLVNIESLGFVAPLVAAVFFIVRVFLRRTMVEVGWACLPVWGVIYSILGALIAAVNLSTVQQVIAAGDFMGGFIGLE